jgi:hypothetical protein
LSQVQEHLKAKPIATENKMFHEFLQRSNGVAHANSVYNNAFCLPNLNDKQYIRESYNILRYDNSFEIISTFIVYPSLFIIQLNREVGIFRNVK